MIIEIKQERIKYRTGRKNKKQNKKVNLNINISTY